MLLGVISLKLLSLFSFCLTRFEPVRVNYVRVEFLLKSEISL